MLTKKPLVSNTVLAAYLSSVLPEKPGSRLTISVYADSDTGRNIKHVIGNSWVENAGREHVGTFEFYDEYAPYSKAAIARIVKHKRAN